MADDRKPWLPALCELPLIGEWVATIVGLLPLIVIMVVVYALGGAMPDDPPAWYLIAGSLMLAAWLMLLERWQKLRINMPYVPVKLLWLCPLLFLVGVVQLFA